MHRTLPYRLDPAWRLSDAIAAQSVETERGHYTAQHARTSTDAHTAQASTTTRSCGDMQQQTAAARLVDSERSRSKLTPAGGGQVPAERLRAEAEASAPRIQRESTRRHAGGQSAESTLPPRCMWRAAGQLCSSAPSGSDAVGDRRRRRRANHDSRALSTRVSALVSTV